MVKAKVTDSGSGWDLDWVKESVMVTEKDEELG